MGMLNAIKSLIYKVDLLDSGSLLRIKGEPEHKTLLGGIISLSLMVLLAAAFWNKIVATFDKQIITASTTVNNADDPLPFNLETLPAGPFMLGAQIFGHDLNGNVRYFDIELSQSEFLYGAFQNTVYYQLQPCTKSHWAGFSKIAQDYDSIGISNWVCLPKNQSFEIRGKYSSQKSKVLNIIAKKCSNSVNDSRPCANQSEIDELFNENGGNLFFSVYFLNPIINPDSQKYLQYYLQDQNYITFSQNGGEESRLFVQDFQIVTDQSILPNEDKMVESGGLITSSVLKSTYTSIKDVYGAFYIFKSSSSSIFNRSFQKLDDVFSYIGGLFGTILILFFLISAYNTYKFEINIAGYLYHKQQRAQSPQKKYNFLDYLGQLIYTTLKSLNCSPNWQKIGYYYETRQEVLKQLDILFIMKRINFLEKSLGYLFTDHQLKGLYMANHYSISQAVSLRKRYKLKSKLKEEIKSLKKNSNAFHREQNVTQSAANNESLKVNENINKMEDDFIIELGLENSFNSDRYSSQSSSQEEDQNGERLLQSLRTLQSQENVNIISKKIWRGMDKRVHRLVEPIFIKDNFEELIKHNSNSRDNILSPFHQPAYKHQYANQSARNRMESQIGDQDIHNHNKTFAKLMFSKIMIVHPENQPHHSHSQK